MSYLVRALKTLKQVQWEKFTTSLKYMGYILLVLIGTAFVYWGIDYLITNFISKV